MCAQYKKKKQTHDTSVAEVPFFVHEREAEQVRPYLEEEGVHLPHLQDQHREAVAAAAQI